MLVGSLILRVIAPRNNAKNQRLAERRGHRRRFGNIRPHNLRGSYDPMRKSGRGERVLCYV